MPFEVPLIMTVAPIKGTPCASKICPLMLRVALWDVCASFDPVAVLPNAEDEFPPPPCRGCDRNRQGTHKKQEMPHAATIPCVGRRKSFLHSLINKGIDSVCRPESGRFRGDSGASVSTKIGKKA